MYELVRIVSAEFNCAKNKRKTLVSLSPYCGSYWTGANGKLGGAGLIGLVAIMLTFCRPGGHQSVGRPIATLSQVDWTPS